MVFTKTEKHHLNPIKSSRRLTLELCRLGEWIGRKERFYDC